MNEFGIILIYWLEIYGGEKRIQRSFGTGSESIGFSNPDNDHSATSATARGISNHFKK